MKKRNKVCHLRRHYLKSDSSWYPHIQRILMHWLYSLKPLPHLLVENTVPSTPRHLCKLCFTAWRLQRKACVCQGGQISAHQSWCSRSLHWPLEQKAKRLSHCGTRGPKLMLQRPIVTSHPKEKTANCHVRNFGLNANIIHRLCPSSCPLIWKESQRVYGAAQFSLQNNNKMTWCLCGHLLQNLLLATVWNAIKIYMWCKWMRIQFESRWKRKARMYLPLDEQEHKQMRAYNQW